MSSTFKIVAPVALLAVVGVLVTMPHRQEKPPAEITPDPAPTTYAIAEVRPFVFKTNSPAAVPTNDNPPFDNPKKQTPDSAPKMPLVWQYVDLSKLNWEDAQVETVAQLRAKFIEELGGDNQDPNTPAYRAKWEKAQPQIDQELAGLVGRKAFLQYESLVSPQK